MAIRLRLADGTTVESDSVEDLARFYHQLSVRNGHRSSKNEPAPMQIDGTLDALPDTANKLVKLLLPVQDGLDTADVAKSLGVGPRGIGGFVTALSNWGKRNGFTKKQLLVKGRRSRGDRIVRTLTLNNHFRQALKEGRIPSMKLDT
jgi:hypothetical protein